MSNKLYVFIVWDEHGKDNLHHEYIGGGEYKVVGIPVTRKVRALWSVDISPSSIAAAEKYISTDHDDFENVRIELLPWEKE